jgi:hypothetical protein
VEGHGVATSNGDVAIVMSLDLSLGVGLLEMHQHICLRRFFSFFLSAEKHNVCTITKINLQNVCDCENNPK